MAVKSISKRRSAVQSVVLPLIFGAAIITAWQTGLLHILLNTDEYVLPYPTRIITIISENTDKIMVNVWASVQVAVLGLLLGSLLGYLIAIFAATFPKFGSGGLTIVSAFNAIPIVALAPVIINWTKDVSSEAEVRSTFAKIIVVTVVSMASMSVNAYRGLTELPVFSDDLMKTYAAGRLTEFTKLRLPNSVPYIFKVFLAMTLKSLLIRVDALIIAFSSESTSPILLSYTSSGAHTAFPVTLKVGQ